MLKTTKPSSSSIPPPTPVVRKQVSISNIFIHYSKTSLIILILVFSMFIFVKLGQYTQSLRLWIHQIKSFPCGGRRHKTKTDNQEEDLVTIREVRSPSSTSEIEDVLALYPLPRHRISIHVLKDEHQDLPKPNPCLFCAQALDSQGSHLRPIKVQNRSIHLPI